MALVCQNKNSWKLGIQDLNRTWDIEPKLVNSDIASWFLGFNIFQKFKMEKLEGSYACSRATCKKAYLALA